ncbi:HNH endonuclease [Marinicella rhabdoformis]|uniref:HNH endonuclease n=1 Tax=Marinicella rhabdoformis TaxID=2580566 RepID=UPI0012AECA6B|nr:hypothetical protein [Marinicella rhabdoformis]
MRKINPPSHDAEATFNLCFDSIPGDKHDLIQRIGNISKQILDAGNEYALKADTEDFHQIKSVSCKNDQIAIGQVTKAELKGLYTEHMVPKRKPARNVYDEIKSLAINGICPYCGVGFVNPLDHYLPKSKFPLISVLPINLVPSCQDCNKDKLSGIATEKRKLTLHPYFSDSKFYEKQWLYAEVIETRPASIQFLVNPPSDWDEESKNRVKVHFNDFDLNSKYVKLCAEELSTLKDLLGIYLENTGVSEIKNYLNNQFLVQYRKNKNSWQSAMYQALSNNDWYCQGGFN